MGMRSYWGGNWSGLEYYVGQTAYSSKNVTIAMVLQS